MLPPKRHKFIPRPARYGRHVLDTTIEEIDAPDGAMPRIERLSVSKSYYARMGGRNELILLLEDYLAWLSSHGLWAAEQPEQPTLDFEQLASEAKLSRRQSRVLELRLDGHSWEDIANTLEIEERTVRMHHLRAMVKIRAFLADWLNSQPKADALLNTMSHPKPSKSVEGQPVQ